MNIFIEASGSLVSGFMIKAIKEAGHNVIASDIDSFNHAAALADDFVRIPLASDPELWPKLDLILQEHKVDIVIPSFDETLIDWSKRIDHYAAQDIHVILSREETIRIFQDKWKTYEFFKSINIPTPETSLDQKYSLVKPRFGRGGAGVYVGDQARDMCDMISQEHVKGQEYTIDCFFDAKGKPIYIVPRKRIGIYNGKSTKGVTVECAALNHYIHKIADSVEFRGLINFQAFERDDKEITFIEINPRVAGGMALGMAATENWIKLIIDSFVHKKDVTPKPIKYNLKMARYYAECFIP